MVNIQSSHGSLGYMYKNQYKGFTFSFGSSKCEDNNGKQISKSMDNFNFITGIPCVKDGYGLHFLTKKGVHHPYDIVWPNGIIFHQPGFPCNKGISISKPPFGAKTRVRSL